MDEKKLFKDEGEYFGENYIKLEGKGETVRDILNLYVEHIREGYNLTVEEICNYLQCSKVYFLSNYRDSIKHIRITVIVRDIFFTLLKKGELDLLEADMDKLIRLFLKRILYNREDFNRFIKENCFVEHKYKRLTLEDFNLKIVNFKDRMDTIDLLNGISFDLYGRCKEGIIKPINYVPDELNSLKTALKEFGMKYDVEFYRLVKAKGVNKICLGNLARYDLEDFEEYPIKVNYKAWDKHEDEVKANILKVYKLLIRHQKKE
jgi:hypothetical protein